MTLHFFFFFFAVKFSLTPGLRNNGEYPREVRTKSKLKYILEEVKTRGVSEVESITMMSLDWPETISFDDAASASISSHSTDEQCHKRFECRYVIFASSYRKEETRSVIFYSEPRSRACRRSTCLRNYYCRFILLSLAINLFRFSIYTLHSM